MKRADTDESSGQYSRGLYAGFLVGLSAGGALLAFALWLGIALGTSL